MRRDRPAGDPARLLGRMSISPRWLAAALLLVLAAPAAAHGDKVYPGESPWLMWQWSPEILVGLAIAGAIFWRGSRHGLTSPWWRILSFMGGLTALFVALVSPVEMLADHIFAVHQVEHMLLRTVAPMLIFLARPQAALVRGMPGGVSRFFAGSGGLRTLVSALRLPVVATLLFLLSSYFWMIPRWHDLAILNEPVHYLWHVSLLVSGLLFFSVIFDRRIAPQGPGLGTRLAMFAAAALGNIVLGAFLTFKSEALYSAYLVMGHLWNVSMLSDEQTGGVIMWIPGTMMFAISGLVIVYRWASEETRLMDRRVRTGRDLQALQRPANRLLAFGLAGFAMLMLAITFSVAAVIDHPASAKHDFGIAGRIPG
jgi:putative membrane protein